MGIFDIFLKQNAISCTGQYNLIRLKKLEIVYKAKSVLLLNAVDPESFVRGGQTLTTFFFFFFFLLF